MEYPEEIYATRDDGLLTSKQRKNAGAGWGRRLAFDVGYDVGYVAGRTEQSDYIESMSSLESVLTDVEQLEGEDLLFVKRLIERTVRAVRAEQADPLEGYSNLTVAIKDNEPIDWEKLNGLKVQCVKPNIGELQGELKRFSHYYPFTSSAWWDDDADIIYASAFKKAWDGDDGWTLWIEGEIPLRRKTADQLPLGMCFLGTHPEVVGGVELRGVVVTGPSEVDKSVIYSNALSRRAATEVEVVEEYGIGTFQKPEDK